VRVMEYYMDSRNSVYDEMWRTLSEHGELAEDDYYVYQLSDMATDAGKDMIERNASKWHAMQKELLAPKAFGGDIKADNDGKKLTLTFEMRIPSVIMLEITALDDDDGDDDD